MNQRNKWAGYESRYTKSADQITANAIEARTRLCLGYDIAYIGAQNSRQSSR